MAPTSISAAVLFCSIFVISVYQVNGSWLEDVMQPETIDRDLRALEKRRLLNEVEIIEDDDDYEEMFRRSQEYNILYNQLEQMAARDRKDVIRYTPVPAIRRIKMTPPPFVVEPIYRLPQTPEPPGGIQRRPTPAYPYNLVDQPLRQTPRPLRLTPVPPVRPPVYPNEPFELIDDSVRKPLKPTPVPESKLKQTPPPKLMTLNERMWQRVLARRARAENSNIERQRSYMYYS